MVLDISQKDKVVDGSFGLVEKFHKMILNIFSHYTSFILKKNYLKY